jgi:hypothetical protein
MKTMRRISIAFFIGLITLIPTLGGCSSFSSSSIENFEFTETPFSTSTIVWFPPTTTPTKFIAPIVQPTKNLLEDIGPLALSDDFSDKTSWQVGEKPEGSMEYSTNRLTLAIRQPKGNIFSFRIDPILGNAYVEITTSTSLCMGNDSYGLLFHASSKQDFHRLLINCNGSFRLERVRDGVVNVLVNWTTSSQLSAGAPLTLKLGVWMKRKSIRIFINNVFQVEASDDAFFYGWLGVFCRSSGNTAVTVNFSDLRIYSLASESPTPITTPSKTPQK